MKKLFLIDGAGGPAKNNLVDIIKREYESAATKEVCLIRKESTRGFKAKEDESIQDVKRDPVTAAFLEEQVAKGKWYKYEYNNQKYGIDIFELEKALAEYENVFLIVRSKALIKFLKDKYESSSNLGFRINVVPIFLYSDKKNLTEELIKKKESDEAIKDRLEKLEWSYDDYLNDNDNVYEDIIIYCGDRKQFKNIIANLINKYKNDNDSFDEISVSKNERYKLPGAISMEAKKEILQNMTNFERNVFLMIKYPDENTSKLQLIIDKISKALSDFGFNCVLAKDMSLTQDSYNTMAVSYCCKYGIAVFEGKHKGRGNRRDYNYNPNVAYELAIMHVLGKKCLILLHNSYEGEKKFFDITHSIHSLYNDERDVGEAVIKWAKELGHKQMTRQK